LETHCERTARGDARVHQGTGGLGRTRAGRSGCELDWDGSREHAPTTHAEGIVEKSFRRGLLSVRLKIPKSGTVPDQPNVGGKTPEEADEITHVIVNLFDKLIGPVVSQMSNLAIGVFAGSAAGGTTAGFGMAGGLGMAGPPAAFATGVATAVPVGAGSVWPQRSLRRCCPIGRRSIMCFASAAHHDFAA
jgi:hypothetical protein